jgi:hypothetical protein
MRKYFVIYNDGYYDNGDVGWTSFDTLDDAVKFIEDRLSKAADPSLDNYTVIEGWCRKIEVVEVVRAVKIS